ncbi:glycosyltransferase family 9 protein [Rhizosphaericola mali]|uniref:Glycosyltransferase family 9 protein n=1 Tax=Rhizosphaericola mali TaxID=2545455 RepID=A0A5P2G5L5_9BACT|nr:glycosyltransferase family 9 protein [Rhizosphaericola mali]QES89050.1 glycosyltransferase family 9 protein [Rhizosphaericola mali]
MKILIIRFSSIGDIVLTTPVMRCLKEQLDGCEIHYLTKSNFKGIIQNNPFIDKVFLLENNLPEIITQLKWEEYDEVVDLHHNLRTWRIKRKLKVKNTHSFDKLNYQKWLLTKFKINHLPKIHIVDRYLATVGHLGVKNDGKGLDYFIPEKDHLANNLFPDFCKNGYVGVVIGASYETKQLPVNKLKDLCHNIQQPIVLLGGKEDAKIGEELAYLYPNKIWNTCGQFNLNQSAYLVKMADFIISNDTGLMHIAAAFHKKIISIWGNTVPEFGMNPYYGAQKVFSFESQVQDLKCRPCSKIGHHSCPKKHFKCMMKQDVEVIVIQLNN